MMITYRKSSLILGLAALLVACGGEPSSAPMEEPAAPLPSPRTEELATTHPSGVEVPGPSEAVEVVEPRSSEPELRDGAVRLRRLIVATGVEAREPTGAADVFEPSEPRLYAFVEAVNETGAPATLRVTFEPEHGESVGHVSLEVPASAPRFRTWAFSRHVRAAGEWEVVVRDGDGVVLARRPFTVE